MTFALWYHGCDASVVTTVLSGEDTLAPSEKGHDWLGPGIYFWEHGPQRAYDWACDEKQRDPRKIQSPAVLGAYINLGQCFALLDTANTRLLQRMHPQFGRLSMERGRPMPEKKPAPGREDPDNILRFLDCAVVKFTQFTLDTLLAEGKVYQMVRGVFVEGGPAYPGAGIMLARWESGPGSAAVLLGQSPVRRVDTRGDQSLESLLRGHPSDPFDHTLVQLEQFLPHT